MDYQILSLVCCVIEEGWKVPNIIFIWNVTSLTGQTFNSVPDPSSGGEREGSGELPAGCADPQLHSSCQR